MEKILVIDDDHELCDLIVEFVGKEGFAVDTVHDGRTGREMALTGDHVLIVLDVMLPRMNGFEVLRQIRAASSTIPVLMLTARGDDVDRIVGLEMGADDYLPKPFNPRELVARIRAILRRVPVEAPPPRQGAPGQPSQLVPAQPRLFPSPQGAPSRVTVGDLVVDTAGWFAAVGDSALDFTAAEFGVMDMLARNAGHVVSRDQISQEVLGRALAPFDRSIDVHVSSLRRKIQLAGGGEDRIQSVRGVGYLLVLNPGQERSDR